MTEELKDTFADLITDRRYAPIFLKHLFSMPAGTWGSVVSLCVELDKGTESIQKPLVDVKPDCFATWLPHPLNPVQACLVIFYQDEEMETCASIVTRKYLQEMYGLEYIESTKTS